jgi:hypothetical protein
MQASREIFTYFMFNIDISKVMADVEAGKVLPSEIELDPGFVTEYAEKVLCLKRIERDNQSSFGFLVGVDAKKALELPESVLDKPLFLMNIGQGKGLFSMSNQAQPCEVVADGNHRLSRAYLDERKTPLKALVFSQAQTKKYLL